MQKAHLFALSALVLAIPARCARPSEDFQPKTVIALERAALDRWGNGDPQGYLDTYAPGVECKIIHRHWSYTKPEVK